MSAGGTSVTLCCAEVDEPRLAAVVEHLQAEGYDPKVLPGVEKDPHVLGMAVDAERGKHLFVLCRSPNLSGSDVLRLEGIFGARKGPTHRLAAGRLNPDNPLELVKAIRSAMSGFSSPQPEEREKSLRDSMRDIVGVTGISAVGSSNRPVAPVERRMASRETPADPLAMPLTGKAGEHAARVPAHQSGGWQVKAKIEDTLGEQEAPLKSDPSDPDAPPSLLPAPQAPTNEKMMPALIGGLIVAVVGVGVMLVLSRDGAEEPGPARSAAAPAAAVAPAPEPKPEPKPVPVPVPEPVVDGESDGESGGGETGEVEVEDGQREQDTSLGGDDEATAISEAIAVGELRAIDNTLVLMTGETENWREASTHCRRKRVRGVGGWRLPSMLELKVLRSARLLKRGKRYWSGTRTAHGSEEVYVLDQGTRKVEVVHKESEDVEVLCVRLR